MSTLSDRASVEFFEFVVQSFAQQNQEITGSAWECFALKKSAFLPFSFSPRAHYTGKVWADRCFRAAVSVTRHARPNGCIYIYIYTCIPEETC